MATSAVDQNAVTNSGSGTGKKTTERFDIAYGLQTKVDKAGTIVKDEKTGQPVREAVMLSPETANELEQKNLFAGSVITVSVDYPATFDDLMDIASKPAIDDDGSTVEVKDVQAELLKLFVNGAKSKVMNRLRSKLTKTDDNGNIAFKDSDAPDGILDVTNQITSGSKRIFLTEEQKMWKSIVFLPQSSKESVWRAYLTGIGKEFYIPEE